MTKAMNTEAIERATNKSWDKWIKELDESGARNLTHKELARRLYDELDGKLENHGWWAQGITVAYEQHIGKRIPGQLASGLFELSVSKTIIKPRSEVFALITEWFSSHNELNGQELLKKRTSETVKRSNWRCNFIDGSKFAATVEGEGIKCKLILTHTDVPSQEKADEWKLFWKKLIEEIAQ